MSDNFYKNSLPKIKTESINLENRKSQQKQKRIFSISSKKESVYLMENENGNGDNFKKEMILLFEKLNDTSTRQGSFNKIKEVFSKFGNNGKKIKEIVSVLNYYKHKDISTHAIEYLCLLVSFLPSVLINKTFQIDELKGLLKFLIFFNENKNFTIQQSISLAVSQIGMLYIKVLLNENHIYQTTTTTNYTETTIENDIPIQKAMITAEEVFDTINSKILYKFSDLTLTSSLPSTNYRSFCNSLVLLDFSYSLISINTKLKLVKAKNTLKIISSIDDVLYNILDIIIMAIEKYSSKIIHYTIYQCMSILIDYFKYMVFCRFTSKPRVFHSLIDTICIILRQKEASAYKEKVSICKLIISLYIVVYLSSVPTEDDPLLTSSYNLIQLFKKEEIIQKVTSSLEFSSKDRVSKVQIIATEALNVVKAEGKDMKEKNSMLMNNNNNEALTISKPYWKLGDKTRRSKFNKIRNLKKRLLSNESGKEKKSHFNIEIFSDIDKHMKKSNDLNANEEYGNIKYNQDVEVREDTLKTEETIQNEAYNEKVDSLDRDYDYMNNNEEENYNEIITKGLGKYLKKKYFHNQDSLTYDINIKKSISSRRESKSPIKSFPIKEHIKLKRDKKKSIENDEDEMIDCNENEEDEIYYVDQRTKRRYKRSNNQLPIESQSNKMVFEYEENQANECKVDEKEDELKQSQITKENENTNGKEKVKEVLNSLKDYVTYQSNDFNMKINKFESKVKKRVIKINSQVDEIFEKVNIIQDNLTNNVNISNNKSIISVHDNKNKEEEPLLRQWNEILILLKDEKLDEAFEKLVFEMKDDVYFIRLFFLIKQKIVFLKKENLVLAVTRLTSILSNKKIEIMGISLLKRIFSYYDSSLLNGDICKENRHIKDCPSLRNSCEGCKTENFNKEDDYDYDNALSKEDLSVLLNMLENNIKSQDGRVSFLSKEVYEIVNSWFKLED